MIEFHLKLEDGWIYLGPLVISWAQAIPEPLDLPAFFTIGLFGYQLEFGELDQGAPGIYLTHCDDDDCRPILTLLQFKSTSTTL